MKTMPFFLVVSIIIASIFMPENLKAMQDSVIVHVPKDTLASTRPDSSSTDSVKVKTDTLTKARTKSWVIRGEVNISTGFYRMTGLDAPRGQMLPWGFTGKLTLASKSGWIIPITGIYSSQSNRFRQPYNQVGASPVFKEKLILHAGYRNVYFSPLTLAGHTFLGGGAELQQKKLRLGFVYGKFNRAIEYNLAQPDIIPYFKRTGFAARAGFGTKVSFLDLIVMKVADDVNSINTLPEEQAVSPAENLVVGLSSRIRIKKKFTFEMDGSTSVFTRDTRAEAISDFVSIPYYDVIKKVFVPRISTQLSTAFQTAIGYRARHFNGRLQYKRIEPDFKTMGAYYFQNDIESYTASPNLTLFKSKLKLNTSIGLQHDNLLNQKKAQTNRLIGSVALVYAPDENLSLDAFYSNYGITQKAGYMPIIDTLRISQNNRTLSANGIYMKMGETTVKTFTATAIYQELQDLNSHTSAFNENKNWNYSVSYTYQDLVSDFDFSLNYSYTLTKAEDLNSLFHGPTLSLNKRTLKSKNMLLSANAGYMFSEQNIYEFIEKGGVLNASASVSYTLFEHHNLSLNWSIIKSTGGQAFSENRGSVAYQLTF